MSLVEDALYVLVYNNLSVDLHVHVYYMYMKVVVDHFPRLQYNPDTDRCTCLWALCISDVGVYINTRHLHTHSCMVNSANGMGLSPVLKSYSTSI